jgi:AcrR family transcriptional regulator
VSEHERSAYLTGVDGATVDQLTAVNAVGVRAFREYLASREAVAFLGAGASVPLYPLWAGVIGELIDAAAERGLDAAKARTLGVLAADSPDAVVEQLRRHLGTAQFRAALRATFAIRRDGKSGRTWTATHELVCRCTFRGVVTTNYDPGIVDARGKVRSGASATGFSSWTDELGLDDWLTGDVFGRDELPVLFANGHHNQPDAMVLATTEYRRAYAGKLARVLARLVESMQLVWIGFSFTDGRIAAVLREVAENAGTRIDPGRANRHIAVMGWDPASGDDPQTLTSDTPWSVVADSGSPSTGGNVLLWKHQLKSARQLPAPQWPRGPRSQRRSARRCGHSLTDAEPCRAVPVISRPRSQGEASPSTPAVAGATYRRSAAYHRWRAWTRTGAVDRVSEIATR